MNSVKEIIDVHLDEWEDFVEGTKDFDINSSLLFSDLYSYFCLTGEMPYGTMKARTGDPDQWIANELEKYIDHCGILRSN